MKSIPFSKHRYFGFCTQECFNRDLTENKSIYSLKLEVAGQKQLWCELSLVWTPGHQKMDENEETYNLGKGKIFKPFYALEKTKSRLIEAINHWDKEQMISYEKIINFSNLEKTSCDWSLTFSLDTALWNSMSKNGQDGEQEP